MAALACALSLLDQHNPGNRVAVTGAAVLIAVPLVLYIGMQHRLRT